MPVEGLKFDMTPEDFVAQVARIFTWDDTLDMWIEEYGITDEAEKEEFKDNSALVSHVEILGEITTDLESVVHVARQMMELRETGKQDTGYIEKNYPWPGFAR